MTALLTIVQGLSSIVRSWALYPLDDRNPSINLALTFILIDESAFYTAVWLFSAMLFETALDIERLFGKSTQEDVQVVKKNFNIARIIVAALIVLV